MGILPFLTGFRPTCVAVRRIVFSTITHLADGGVFWILLAVVLLVIPKTRWFAGPGPWP